ncbi:hypothetical protein CWB41_04840 [Methylovirgula ligni]|uniref:Chemotaxis signal transduction protein n=1 Tax=Methylovirgula ligni TaxID=569860 RepID=A0A3D9ZDN6_9HYPH|nr:hypothetical protein [Methylovirgula ligni]QAY95139.1 hypothetical protein CWB41_04840 [Methylovirgula ligni]REF89576.1 hypothetical protein DES32_0801 [Methylovirgula ligni]
MPEERYLLCRVERYAIAIGVDAVRNIGGTDSAPPDRALSSARIDLRALLQVPVHGPGVVVALRIDDADISLIVETVARIETIADSAFAPLPPAFEHARSLFDGACRRPIDGQHPLRLRLQPLAAPAAAPL